MNILSQIKTEHVVLEELEFSRDIMIKHIAYLWVQMH